LLWLGIHAVEFAKGHPPEFALILREMAQGQTFPRTPISASLSFRFADRSISSKIIWPSLSARSRAAGVTAGTVPASPTPLPRGKQVKK